MDLRQMRYFLAVARERNFGRAAQRLHMAQPPLTRQIRAIEEELGVELFVRTTKGVELTEAAYTMVEEVENLLALAERAEERVRSTGHGLAGHLDVGVFGSGILNVVPRVMANFHKLRPDVTIGLRNMSKADQILALRERRLNVGFARLIPSEKDLGIEIVRREPVLVALYDGHPLCEKVEITVRDLDSQPMILYPTFSMTGLAQMVAEAFRRGRAKLRVEQEVEDAVTAIALVSSGFGLCVTTESAASLRLPGVTYRPLRSTHMRDIEMSCFYRKDDRSPVLRAFLEVVRDYAASTV
jgi:DNA-binding transcriptional LysR family regulator